MKKRLLILVVIGALAFPYLNKLLQGTLGAGFLYWTTPMEV